MAGSKVAGLQAKSIQNARVPGARCPLVHLPRAVIVPDGQVLKELRLRFANRLVPS